MYHYAGNNPIKYTDPDGKIAFAAPLIFIGVEELGKALVAAACTVITYQTAKTTAKTIAKAIENSKNRNQNGEYVYHSTNFQPFVDSLMKDGNSAINKSKTDPKSRFGQQFYVASDPNTARAEATVSGSVIKFKLSENARVLDLTDSSIANKLGYSQGMSRDEARDLMKSWNLAGVDAIRYPSEKNPGGYNYAVFNITILTPIGVE